MRWRGRHVVIAEALRTPIGRWHEAADKKAVAADLASTVVCALVERSGIDASEVEAVLTSTRGRGCRPAHQALAFGAALVASGVYHCIVAGGVDRHATGDPVGEGAHAERVAERFALSRGDCDEIAVRSHRRAANAIRNGRFARETVPVEVDGAMVVSDQDVCGGDAELAQLAELPPLYKPGGRVTAGNSARASDGAAAVLLLSSGKAAQFGIRPRARILDHMAVASDRERRLEGPMVATSSILRRNHMTLADIDRFEVDELFAPVVAAWTRDYEQDPATVNVRGGAIALGHPSASTAARVVTTMLHVLEDEDAEVGLVTMGCDGGGTAALIQRL